VKLDSLFFGSCRFRLWSVSRTRHSAKHVVGSEQLETGGSDTPGSAPRENFPSRHGTMIPIYAPLSAHSTGHAAQLHFL
jgi:hypothetical protein